MLTKLEQAQNFIKSGIAVIPLRHRGKEPQADMIGGTWERYKQELPTEYQAFTWLSSTWHNYGVVCGWRGLAVIDFDNADAFAMWLQWFAVLNKHEEVYPMPYIVKTARGAHVYVSCPVGGGNEKRRGVDLKYHGYVVGPGSTHPSGTQYVPMGEFRLIDVYSMATILPDELFPRVAPVPAAGQTGDIFFAPACVSEPQDYDPFALATNPDTGDLISKVKARVRIENLFTDVIRTSNDGRWFAALCPFHDDHNPSMWIDTRRQLCGCNTCGMKPMDALNLYARMHNCSESVAVTELAREVKIWG